MNTDKNEMIHFQNPSHPSVYSVPSVVKISFTPFPIPFFHSRKFASIRG
jgi:hypothetical protein